MNPAVAEETGMDTAVLSEMDSIFVTTRTNRKPLAVAALDEQVVQICSKYDWQKLCATALQGLNVLVSRVEL